MLVIPHFYRYRCNPRRAVCLTSPSKDGAIIARVMAHFGIGNVRGSSSRRGSEAVRELADALTSGLDVAITPDGPRGPKYRLQPGALRLAQISGVPITLVHIVYSRYWELKSWDRFRIPKPFSRVTIICDEPVAIPRELDEAAFEAMRAKMETRMVCMAEKAGDTIYQQERDVRENQKHEGESET